MRNVKKLFMFATILAVSACSSTFPKEKVLARADGLTETPSWASFTTGSFTEEGKVSFIGIHDTDSTGRLSTGCKVAAAKAKGEISSEIQQKLSFVMQHAEEGNEIGNEQTRYIAGEISKLTVSDIRYDGCYWEQIAFPISQDEYRTGYRFFAKVGIKKDKLEKAIRKASKGELSEEFAKRTVEHWDDLVQ